MRALMVGISAVVFLCASFPAYARTWDVPSEAPTIQAGIDSAAVGDTVLVACGTYYEHNIVMKSGITLRSETGEADCATIDAEQQGRVLYFENVDVTAFVEGLTITGGSANHGGGVYCAYSSAVFTRCTITGNGYSHGAGMMCGSSSVTVAHCSFIENGGAYGGGMGLYSGSYLITDCVFGDNTANHAAGLHCRWGTDTVVANCTFYGNWVHYGGAGIDCWEGASPIIVNCTFYDNDAQWEGGGLRCADATALVESCTFYGNRAGVRGGGIACDVGSVLVRNTIVASNSREAVSCVSGGSASMECCDVYGNSGGDWVGCIAGQYGINGNISEDPLFCDPGNYDLRLQSGSPCAPANNPECGLVGAWPVCVLPATVDFDPNTLNCASHGGYVTCYIELPDGYDPGDIDIATVALNDSVFAVSWPTAVGDHDSDGVPDLMVKFARGQVIALLPVGDDVEVRIAGELGDGTLFEGSDLIRVICRKGPLVAALPAPSLRVDSGQGPTQAIVTYGVVADGHVRVRVYDVAGRLVTTLVDGRRTTGEHSIVWDGRSTAGIEVSAGVYFVALESADGTRTAKVIVLK